MSLTDERRLQIIAHDCAGEAAYFQNMLLLIRRKRERNVPVDEILDDIEGDLERCAMRARATEFFARGADEAADQMHEERLAHYRKRHPR